jgi:abhydrolase domain-containing protein 17
MWHQEPVENLVRTVFSLLWKILLFVFVLLVLASHLLVDGLIFQPPPASYVADSRYFQVQTERGESIACRYLASPGSRYLVIYSHGNAEDLGGIEPVLRGFAQAGLSVLAYDYPGYGISTGRPSEASVYRAVEAVTAHAIRHLGFEPRRIVFHGRSLGSGPAVEMCRRGAFGGLVIESGFTSVFDVGAGITWLPWDRFRNLKKIHELQEPTMVIHGTEDGVVPFRHGQQLFEGSQAPKFFYWVEGARHNDLIPFMGDEYWTILQEFVSYLEQ